MRESIGIGIAGLGTVGGGVVRMLRRNRSLIRSVVGADVVIQRVAELDESRLRALHIGKETRARSLDELINDPRVSVVVELIGGTGVAREVVTAALRAGKHVVTANKALLATHWRGILSLAARKGCAVGFESSVMAGVPVVRSLEQGLAGNRVRSILGILNGTSNFILTRMLDHGEEFPSALEEARRRGLCEADASLDIDGHDAAQKLSILGSIALGRWLPPGKVFREGIRQIEHYDLCEARGEFGYVLRPLAVFKTLDEGVEARVHPTFVPATHPLAAVSDEFNAALIRCDTAGPIMLTGKGAGKGPAASGVMSDVVALARFLMRRSNGPPPPRVPAPGAPTVIPMSEVESKFYLRFSVIDKPGVLSYIAGVLGEHDVSIAGCYQRGRSERASVPVIMVTHEAREGSVRRALTRIDRARRIIKRKTVAIRIEE